MKDKFIIENMLTHEVMGLVYYPFRGFKVGFPIGFKGAVEKLFTRYNLTPEKFHKPSAGKGVFFFKLYGKRFELLMLTLNGNSDLHIAPVRCFGRLFR